MNASPHTRNVLPPAASTFMGTVYTYVLMNYGSMIEMQYLCLNPSTDQLFDKFPTLPIDIFTVVDRPTIILTVTNIKQDSKQRLRSLGLGVCCPRELARAITTDVLKNQ
jgi:hypothetical protein